MKWAAIVFALVCILSLEQRVERSSEEAQRIAREAACRTIVEAGLVTSCTVVK